VKIVTFALTDAEYVRLVRRRDLHHASVNKFYSEQDLPQVGIFPLEEFARARLLVAIETDEEIEAHLSKMPTPNGGGRP
jgi:hypothetical protein